VRLCLVSDEPPFEVVSETICETEIDGQIKLELVHTDRSN
jgi:hypothetical protein